MKVTAEQVAEKIKRTKENEELQRRYRDLTSKASVRVHFSIPDDIASEFTIEDYYKSSGAWRDSKEREFIMDYKKQAI